MENAIYVVECSVKGKRPLMQNEMAIETADAAKTKTGQTYDDQEEATKRLILNPQKEICQKAEHFESAMVKASASFKITGHKTYKDLFKACVFVEPLLIPHNNQVFTIDKRFVRIGTARVLRCRPRFDDWTLDFTISVTDDRLQPAVLKQIFEDAGKSYGVGDYRPRYGLYEVVKFDVIESKKVA